MKLKLELPVLQIDCLNNIDLNKKNEIYLFFNFHITLFEIEKK